MSLHVLIDARLAPGSHGGVETVVHGLAEGLGGLNDGDELYTFVVTASQSESFAQRLGPATRLLVAAPPPQWPRLGVSTRLASRFSVRAAERLRAVGWRLRRGARRAMPSIALPDADLDLTGVDVVHFPFQRGFRTDIPTVFQPHDLQHIHLPFFFTADERAKRDATYRALIDQAEMVVVGSRWVAGDLIQRWRVSPTRVRVVPLAPLTRLTAGPLPSGLPAEFAFYPAATWPHKNHARLIQALAQLHDAGLVVPLVCSGQLTAEAEDLRSLAMRLGIQEHIHFLGFVPDDVLGALYASARLVVVPTLFEAGSFPVWESFQAGTPVVCSAVTSLPEQAGGAALLFDPEDVEAIATAIRTGWTDEAIRVQLRTAGRQRVSELSWIDTAERFRAVYRLIAGRGDVADLAVLDKPTPL